MALTYGSLFSGVGGFDMGFDPFFECQWQAEWDAHCQQTLSYHYPEVPKYGDVQEVNGAAIKPVDVIIFGSPCQDLSVAGKRAGLEGSRSSMFFEAMRIIKEMQDATSSGPDGTFPRAVVWENVAGALSSNGGKDFGVVLDSLADLGALAIEWHILDARWCGVPQRRRRVFVVAIFDPGVAEHCPIEILPVASRGGWNPPTRKSSWQAVAPLAPGGIGAIGATGDISPAVTSKWHKGVGGPSGDECQNMVLEPTIAFQPGGMSRLGGCVWEETAPTLRAEAHSGDNSPHVAQPVKSTAYSIREDATANNFSATETDTALSVTALQPSVQSHHAQIFIVQEDGTPRYSFDTQFGSNADVFDDCAPPLKASQAPPSVAEPLIIDGTRLNDVRVYDDGATPCLTQRMGTGGNNVPWVAEPFVKGRRAQSVDDDETWRADETSPTLNAFDNTGESRATVLTVEQTLFEPKSMGDENWAERDLKNALRAGASKSSHAIVDSTIVIDRAAFNQGENAQYGIVAEERDDMPSLVAKGPHAVMTHYAVRRLTPLECERLQGWPDNHTLYRADGKTNSDTTRYKMCGNGVATPVAYWVASHLAPLLTK